MQEKVIYKYTVHDMLDQKIDSSLTQTGRNHSRRKALP